MKNFEMFHKGDSKKVFLLKLKFLSLSWREEEGFTLFLKKIPYQAAEEKHLGDNELRMERG